MSRYYYLADNLSFPFDVTCLTERKILPLKEGQIIKTLTLAPEKDCESEIFVIINWHENLGAPLSQL